MSSSYKETVLSLITTHEICRKDVVETFLYFPVPVTINEMMHNDFSYAALGKFI